MQRLNPLRTSWHITFGTYGTRFHHGPRATVDKQHNQFSTPFLPYDPLLERIVRRSMSFQPRLLTDEQQEFIEDLLPVLCDRGGWDYRIGAASADHVHLLCDIAAHIHGERALRLLKRWLSQALSRVWPLLPGERWWAVEGSNKAVREQRYLNNAYGYILRQRATPPAVANETALTVQ